MNRFQEALSKHGFRLEKEKIRVLQVNLGRLCNLTCVHCHVESGPTKTRENMARPTAEAVVRFLDRVDVPTLDLTGGAPELNPHFRYLVEEARRRNLSVINRCNLTVLYEPGQEGLAEFLAGHHVEIVASLPCYSRENVDKQRGRGTFGKSVDALLWLNRLGYGKPESGKMLHLVYNPVGAHLPPAQEALERDYKKRLREDFGIEFNRLFTITNMPITRYAMYLRAMRQYEGYVNLLADHFNPSTLAGLMCRDTLSVGWDGRVYDCDFNQALRMEIANGRALHINDLTPDTLRRHPVLTGEHCFGCTAGAGSSCQGAIG